MTELRRATSRDADFLFQVFRETRRGSCAGLDPELSETLLLQQSALQESQYDEKCPQLERFVIQRCGRAAGRLYLAEDCTELILADISILPSEQQKGTGTQVLTALLQRAAAEERAVRLHVLADSPARGWYRRHGFEQIAVHEPYVEMVFNAD